MITKAIILAAGLGTRMLPITKSIPKALLPVGKKPVIQYLVEEVVNSGIDQIILVTRGKEKIVENYFKPSTELEKFLIKAKKNKLAKTIQKISSLAKFNIVKQRVPRGDGQALLLTKHLIEKGPVAVLFEDDLVFSKTPCLKQLLKVFKKYQKPIIALQKVPKKDLSRYGVVKAKKVDDRIFKINDLVEKPPISIAPSNLAIVGKYILTPEIFKELEKVKPDQSGEIKLTYALVNFAKKDALYGYQFEGKRFDCGNEIGWLKANLEIGLRYSEFKKYLENLDIK